jgi:GNAT superfamily N-acetyltransferase
MSVDKEDELVKQVQRQQRQRGYRLVAGYGKAAREEEVVAVAGFTFRENLAAGRHMYVEDLVVDSNCRSRGVGTSLFAWLEQEAQKCGCDSIHLDSGLQRIDAHRFYEQQGMQYAAKYFFKAL